MLVVLLSTLSFEIMFLMAELARIVVCCVSVLFIVS